MRDDDEEEREGILILSWNDKNTRSGTVFIPWVS